jgi:hypothetical protein
MYFLAQAKSFHSLLLVFSTPQLSFHGVATIYNVTLSMENKYIPKSLAKLEDHLQTTPEDHADVFACCEQALLSFR